LMGLGQEDGHFEEYGKDLKNFAAFCGDNEEFRNVITNQVFTLDDRRAILKMVLDKSQFSGTVQNFLNLLLDKNRIGAIDEIADYYERLTDEISNIARAEIITARPIKGEAQQKLVKVLEDLTSKSIQAEGQRGFRPHWRHDCQDWGFGLGWKCKGPA